MLRERKIAMCTNLYIKLLHITNINYLHKTANVCSIYKKKNRGVKTSVINVLERGWVIAEGAKGLHCHTYARSDKARAYVTE